MTKKQLKKRNKRLKKEHKQLWRDYEDLGNDYSSYVNLYHDVISLLAKFDAELLRSVVDGCTSGYTLTIDTATASLFKIDKDGSVEELKL